MGWGQKVQTAWLDLFFPRRCAGCGEVGEWLCQSCSHNVQSALVPLETGSALFNFQEPVVRELLHYLKYNGIYEAAPTLVALAKMKVGLPKLKAEFGEDAILIPVPVSSAKRKKRGYNQADLLAQELGGWLGYPVWSDALQKVAGKESRVGKNRREREAQVMGKYICNFEDIPERFQDRQWILLDDVCTTGSTLRACTQALQKHTPLPIKWLTVAREG